MANLSNINNKFLVTTGGNVLIGQTSAVGSSIFQVTGNSTFTGNVGINIAANSSRSLTVLSRIACVVSGTTANAAILFGDDDDDSQGQIRYNNSDDSMELRTNSTERIRISSNGTTKITTDGTEQLILHRSDSSIFLNNTIGTIKVTADDPTANVVGGQIQFTGGGTWSSNNYPTNIIFSNDNAGTLTERMRIDSSGASTFVPISTVNFIVTNSGNALRLIAGLPSGATWVGKPVEYYASEYSFSTDTTGAGSYSQQLVIENNGDVGIGVSSPIKKLQVSSFVAGDLINILCVNRRDQNGDTASIGFSMTDTNLYNKAAVIFERTTTQGRGSLHFATNNVNSSANVGKADARMTILSGGNVGIGTTSPVSKLEVNGSIKASGAFQQLTLV